MGFLLVGTYEAPGDLTGRIYLTSYQGFVTPQDALCTATNHPDFEFSNHGLCVKGFKLKASQIKKLTNKEIEEILDSEYMILIAQEQVGTIRTLTESIRRIEKKVKSEITLKKEFEMLLTIPGIGVILALTIMLEVGNINRFERVGNFTSYCRCVPSC